MPLFCFVLLTKSLLKVKTSNVYNLTQAPLWHHTQSGEQLSSSFCNKKKTLNVTKQLKIREEGMLRTVASSRSPSSL